MTAADRIAAAAAAADYGKATAAKRGRNPKWPYVPIIDHRATPDRSRGYTQQIRGKAFATREEAVAYAQATIDANRAALAKRLADKGQRALREQYGLPRELEELT